VFAMTVIHSGKKDTSPAAPKEWQRNPDIFAH
jgi:hypothetical protein